MSLWGEIVEPASRAAWNDGDEEEDNAIASLSWNKDLIIKAKYDTLLILEGKQLGSYDDAVTGLVLKNVIPEINLKLFEDVENSRIICCIQEYDLMKSSEIVELLHGYLSVSCKVIAVLIKSLSDYKVQSQSTTSCVIRMLSTTKWKPDVVFPQLEQPNIISGVSAGAVCVREHIDRNAVVYVCYLEHPDAMNTSELQVLLQQLAVPPPQHPGHRTALTTSNLYI